MVANVVFHEFGHETVNRSPCCREPLQDVCALFIIIERAQNGLQLPDDLLCPVYKVQLFSRCVRHFVTDYLVGVWYQALGWYGMPLEHPNYIWKIQLENQNFRVVVLSRSASTSQRKTRRFPPAPLAPAA